MRLSKNNLLTVASFSFAIKKSRLVLVDASHTHSLLHNQLEQEQVGKVKSSQNERPYFIMLASAIDSFY